MRNLVAFPILTLAVIIQSSIVSGIPLLRGYADLTLVIVIAWSLQEGVTTAWHWAIVAGALTSFVTGLPWAIPMAVFLMAIFFSKTLQKRIWHAPLIALFTVTFLASLVSHLISFIYLNVTGASIPFADAFSLVTLPSLLLNLLIAIPVFWLTRDLARWIYPIEEDEE
jgi:rod shape-determining protein MreD